MSFFDEVEEETRVRPPRAGRRRGAGGRSGPPRGSRRPPGQGGPRRPDERTIRLRRGVAMGALLVALVLIVVGVHSCAASASNGALRSYNDSVRSLMVASNQNGQRFFSLLARGVGATNAPSLQSQVDATRITADHQLARAQSLSVPGAVRQAQQYLVWTLQMRRDAITGVAGELHSLQGAGAAQAINPIAAEMARLYASDVAYKDYALPLIEQALRNAGIAVGGQSGEPVATGQVLPNLQWLQPSYIAAVLHTSLPAGTTSAAKPAPGIHGHELDSCSVGATTLSTSAATTLPSGSAPTLTCTVTNDGQNTETNVVVRATVEGTSVSGQGIIPQTQPGQQYTVQIPLSAAPPAGTYSLNVTVEHVPGETTFTHNTKIFPVTFG